MLQEIDIVFDAPPGPVSGHFIEVEDTKTRASISVGEWVKREDGFWVLRNIGHVLTYIDRHSAELGFEPTAVGVNELAYKHIWNELRAGQTIKINDAKLWPEDPQEHFYIRRTRVVISRHCE